MGPWNAPQRMLVLACFLLFGCRDNDRVALQSLSSNATLNALALSSGPLQPAFDPNTHAYSARVPNAVDMLTVLASTADGGASFTVNGGPSRDVPLIVGINAVRVQVTAEDGSTRDYVLDVTRADVAASNNADLSALTLSSGVLSPAFQPAQLAYTASVTFSVVSTTVRPTAFAAGAMILVNGAAVTSGADSAPIALVEGVNSITIAVTAPDGLTPQAYTLDVTRLSLSPFTQTAYIKASNTGAKDHFGTSIAISGDGLTMAIGAANEESSASGVNGDPFDNSASRAGAVYVFTRSPGGTWAQEAYIKATNAFMEDQFGASLALSSAGSTLAVGAPFEDSDATGINGDQANALADGSGAVYVYARAQGLWSLEAYVKASNTNKFDTFGSAVALAGDGLTLAVGATGEDGGSVGINGNQLSNSARSAGAVYVFSMIGGLWGQDAYVKASNANITDSFGSAVALSEAGKTLAVGARNEDGKGTGVTGDPLNNDADSAGAAYVFTLAAGTWSEQAYLKSTNQTKGILDNFGTSISLSASGDALAVGCVGESSASAGIGGVADSAGAFGSGAVYLFGRTAGNWNVAEFVKASNPGPGDAFGTSITLSGQGLTLAVGAEKEAGNSVGIGGNQLDNSAPLSGAVYVFELTSGAWSQSHYVKPSNTDPADRFGSAVSLSNDGATLAVGAAFESSSATGVAADDSLNDADAAGAAFVF